MPKATKPKTKKGKGQFSWLPPEALMRETAPPKSKYRQAGATGLRLKSHQTEFLEEMELISPKKKRGKRAQQNATVNQTGATNTAEPATTTVNVDSNSSIEGDKIITNNSVAAAIAADDQNIPSTKLPSEAIADEKGNKFNKAEPTSPKQDQEFGKFLRSLA